MKPNDGVLQLFGGDELTVTYVDESTLDGSRVFSGVGQSRPSARDDWFLWVFLDPAYIAFPGQPQALLLRDADLDVSPKAESVRITVKAIRLQRRTRPKQAMTTCSILPCRMTIRMSGERDSVTLTLTEQPIDGQAGQDQGGQGGNGAIRSGVFTNKVKLALADGTPDPADDVLHCDELDELEVTYVDGASAESNPVKQFADQSFRVGKFWCYRPVCCL